MDAIKLQRSHHTIIAEPVNRKDKFPAGRLYIEHGIAYIQISFWERMAVTDIPAGFTLKSRKDKEIIFWDGTNEVKKETSFEQFLKRRKDATRKDSI